MIVAVEKKTLLSVNSPRKTYWDLFVMLLATYNCYSIPIDIAFEPEAFNTSTFKMFNSLIDCLFLLDMIVSFRTTYLDYKTGVEVKNPKLMA